MTITLAISLASGAIVALLGVIWTTHNRTITRDLTEIRERHRRDVDTIDHRCRQHDETSREILERVIGISERLIRVEEALKRMNGRRSDSGKGDGSRGATAR